MFFIERGGGSWCLCVLMYFCFEVNINISIWSVRFLLISGGRSSTVVNNRGSDYFVEVRGVNTFSFGEWVKKALSPLLHANFKWRHSS